MNKLRNTHLGYIPDTNPTESKIYIIFSKDGSRGKNKGIPLEYWLNIPSVCTAYGPMGT